jgi:adenylate cyclase
LGHEQEVFTRQSWVGQEVSTQTRYFNMSLINNPYKNWTT